jgi:hypothetical protein
VTSKSDENEVTDWGLNGLTTCGVACDTDWDKDGNYVIYLTIEDEDKGSLGAIEANLNAAPDVISYKYIR